MENTNAKQFDFKQLKSFYEPNEKPRRCSTSRYIFTSKSFGLNTLYNQNLYLNSSSNEIHDQNVPDSHSHSLSLKITIFRYYILYAFCNNFVMVSIFLSPDLEASKRNYEHKVENKPNDLDDHMKR